MLMTVDPQERNTQRSGPEVIKLFSCLTQLSTKFQLLIYTKMMKKRLFMFSKTQMLNLSF